MKTIKSLEDITTLEVGDVVVFGNLEYVVNNVFKHNSVRYYLYYPAGYNGIIFEKVNLKKRDFVEKLGIDANCNCDFPEVKSLEVLTALVSALFKEYEKQKELPKTWEEFCERNPIQQGECLISPFCQIYEAEYGSRDADEDRNYYTSKQEAKAFLALMQLRQLRKAYVKDWEPDWTNPRIAKFSITCIEGVLSIFDTVTVHRSMSFPNSKLAEQFLTNFKDLLEIAKPLL
jgi:hypothetical protein